MALTAADFVVRAARVASAAVRAQRVVVAPGARVWSDVDFDVLFGGAKHLFDAPVWAAGLEAADLVVQRFSGRGPVEVDIRRPGIVFTNRTHGTGYNW